MTSVKVRKMVERRIASCFIKEALKAGYTINLNNGGDTDEIVDSTSLRAILRAMFATDDEKLHLFKAGKYVGWVYFVYGNDGYDVISDYTCNLEVLMGPVDQLSDKLAEKYCG